MKNCLLAFLGLMVSIPGFGQISPGEWKWQNPSHGVNVYHDVDFFDTQNGVILSYDHVGLRTADGGKTWTRDIRGGMGWKSKHAAIHIPVDTACYAITPELIWKSTDTGRTWNYLLYFRDSVAYTDVHFGTGSHGIVVGQATSPIVRNTYILITSDAGRTWSEIAFPGIASSSTFAKPKVFFASPDTVWVTGPDGLLLKSTNGGTDWALQPGFDLNTTFEALFFLNGNTGWISTEQSGLHKTTDGGASWQTVAALANRRVHSVQFTSPDTGFAAVSHEGLLQTTDGGASWHAIPGLKRWANVNTGTVLKAVNGHTWTLVGEHGRISTTDDGGQTITDSYVGGEDIFEVRFTNNRTGWAQGTASSLPSNPHPGKVYRTHNGGKKWTEAYRGGVNTNLSAVFALGDSLAWVAGMPAIPRDTGFVEWTTNAGRTWNKVVVAPNTELSSLWLINPQRGFGYGAVLDRPDSARNYLFSTQDGGLTWSRTFQFSSSYGRPREARMQFFNEVQGVLIDARGRIARTSDGGQSWTYFNPGREVIFNDISFIDSQQGWACGFLNDSTPGGNTYHGVWKTVNSGNSWQRISTVAGSRSPSIAFSNSLEGWLVFGDISSTPPTFRTMFRTFDGGRSWETDGVPFSPGGTTPINNIYASPSGEAWAVGPAGRILYYLPSHLTHSRPVAESAKAILHLYPNPSAGLFILDLPEAARVQVLSLQGQLVLDLHQLGAGQHKVDLRRYGKGLYVVRVFNRQGTEVRKAVIE